MLKCHSSVLRMVLATHTFMKKEKHCEVTLNLTKMMTKSFASAVYTKDFELVFGIIQVNLAIGILPF